MKSIKKVFKEKITEISISLCYLLPPVGILFLFTLAFSTIYHTIKEKKHFNFSLPSVFIICLFIATVGSSYQLQNLTLLISSLIVVGYWGLYQKITLNNTMGNFKNYRWIIIFGGLYNYLMGFVNKWVVIHPIIGFMTGTILIGDTPSIYYKRLIGSSYNPNFTMYLLLLSIAFVFAEMLVQIRRKKYTMLSVLIPILLILSDGVIETGSRAGYASMLLIYVLFFIRINKIIFVGVSLLIAIFIIPIFQLMPRNAYIDQSYIGRKQIWINSLQMWMHHPFFGTTPLGFRQEYIYLFGQSNIPHAHDIFVGMLAEYGVFGIIPFFVLLAVTFYKSIRLFFLKEDKNGLLDYFLLGLPIIILTGILDEPLFSPQLALLTVILLGYWEKYAGRFSGSYLLLPFLKLKGMKEEGHHY